MWYKLNLQAIVHFLPEERLRKRIKRERERERERKYWASKGERKKIRFINTKLF